MRMDGQEESENVEDVRGSSGGGGGATASEIASAVADEVLTGHTVPGSLGKTIADIASVMSLVPYKLSAIDDPLANSGSFIGSTGLSTADGFYTGCLVTFVTGSLQGITRSVSDYEGSTLTFTFSGDQGQADAPWPTDPADTDQFMIMGRAE